MVDFWKIPKWLKTWWNSCHSKGRLVFRLQNHIRFFSMLFDSLALNLRSFWCCLCWKKKHRRKRTLKSSVVRNNLIVCFKALRVWSSHSNWVSSLAPYYNLNPRVWNLSSKKTHQKQSWQTWNLTPLDGGSRDVLFIDIWSFRGKDFGGTEKLTIVYMLKAAICQCGCPINFELMIIRCIWVHIIYIWIKTALYIE